MRKREDRVLGPYAHGSGWRFLIRRGNSSTHSRVYKTKEAAERAASKAAVVLQAEQQRADITLGEALRLYEDDQRQRGLRERSIVCDKYRLGAFFLGVDTLRIANLSADVAKGLWTKLQARKSRSGRLYAGAWLKSILTGVKTFGRWLVDTGRTSSNHFATLKHRGLVNKGKHKLTLDEARAFVGRAHQLAAQDYDLAVCALIVAYLALRASEVTALTVRAVDDGGRRLHIFSSKTRAGVRSLPVPTPLQPLLLARCANRKPGDLLFPGRSRWSCWWAVKRICREAGVTSVCPHSFRGLLADLLLTGGEAIERAAQTLGHAGPSVTLAHYADRSLVQDRQLEQGAQLLADHSSGIPKDTTSNPGSVAGEAVRKES